MPHGVHMHGPSASEHAIDRATFHGAIGRANRTMDESAMSLFDSDKFDLGREGKSSRWDKFTSTVRNFAKGGARLGAAVGVGAMLPYDIVMGRGGWREEGYGMDSDSLLDKGVVGLTVRGASMLATSAAEVVGVGAGAVVGTALYPAKCGTDKSMDEWYDDSFNSGAIAGRNTVAGVLGTSAGLALDGLRAPSLLVKYALSAAFAIPSAILGVIGGAIRAIINE